MRALVVVAKGRLELADIPTPKIGPYQALVKVEVCGICSSTDWKVIQGQMPWAGPFPLVLGHESVGSVVEIGTRVRKFRVGDRVTRPIYPRSPQLNSAFGGFAEYGVVTDALTMAADGDTSLVDDYVAVRQNVVPSELEDPVWASLAISLAETSGALIRLPNLRDRKVVVAGTGVAGLAFTLWAKLAGATVITLGRRASRLELAKAIGADYAIDTTQREWRQQILDAAGGLVDGVIDAIGDVDFAAGIPEVVRTDGFAAAYGAPPGGQSYPAEWLNMAVEEHRTFNWVADLLARGRILPREFISHVWDSLADAPAAFAMVRSGEVLKGFIRIS